jgi:hypothetical protein
MNLHPNNAQIDQAAIAHNEFGELIDRLIKEGFDYRSILAGNSAAIAQSIMATAGAKKVPEWFALQSAMTMHLANEPGN